ncbi:MAG: AI-2E family transporter [Acidobacteria bacterium]|nr:AI-2E family transporter [Acidobacteriota bacterium]MBK8813412.1 AI-2E family transporter [Acidobacteriota bacterium]
MPDKKIREMRQTARRVFVDPSTPPMRSVLRVVLTFIIVSTAISAIGFLLFQIRSLIFMIILAIFFAYLIDPLVRLIRRPFKERQLDKLMPRSLAIGVAYIVVFSVLGIAISYLAPRVADQARQFAGNVPAYAKSAQDSLTMIATRYENYKIPKEFQEQITSKINDLGVTLAVTITDFLGTLAFGIISYLPWLILIPILSFFFLKDVQLFRISFLRVFPSGRWRARAESFLSDVNTTLAAYTRAQMISCVLIGVLCTAGFYSFGLNYALLLGIMAGILEFIPLIGPLTLGLTATIVAGVSDSPRTGIYVAVFLIVLRIVHDYVTYPRIVREGIHLHPLAIIISVLAGEQIGGIAGVFLSIPIVALATVFYKHALEHSGTSGIFAGWLEPKEVEMIEESVVQGEIK